MDVLPRVESAVVFAAALHAGQTRKGTSEPYFGHLVGVMEIAARYGATETEMMGAVLHDAVEDQGRGGATAREIEKWFGPEVLAIVEGCTNKGPGKTAYLAHLAEAGASVALVAASDKLYNARSIVAAHREVGEAVWSRFSGSKSEVLAYYRALVGALSGRVPAGLAAELSEAVAEMMEVAR